LFRFLFPIITYRLILKEGVLSARLVYAGFYPAKRCEGVDYSKLSLKVKTFCNIIKNITVTKEKIRA